MRVIVQQWMGEGLELRSGGRDRGHGARHAFKRGGSLLWAMRTAIAHAHFLAGTRRPGTIMGGKASAPGSTLP